MNRKEAEAIFSFYNPLMYFLHCWRCLCTTCFYFCSKGAKRKVLDSKEQGNRQRREEECIIHCCKDTGELAALKDLESWKTLLNAAPIRNHEPSLEIAKTLEEGELPKVTYHRQCRSVFTLKRNLDKLSQLDAKERTDCNSTDGRRFSIRQPTAKPSRIYQRVCIFCEKDKYTRNSRTREELIQCLDMRADEMIRKAAVGKNDHRMLAVVSRELVAAKACYHKLCYRNYTRNIPVSGD